MIYTRDTIFDDIEDKFIRAGEIILLFRACVLDPIKDRLSIYNNQIPLEYYGEIFEAFNENFSDYQYKFTEIFEFIIIVKDFNLIHHLENDYFIDTETQTIKQVRRYLEDVFSNFIRDDQEIIYRKKLEYHYEKVFLVKGCICDILSSINYAYIKKQAYNKESITYDQKEDKSIQYLHYFLESIRSLNDQCNKWFEILNRFHSLPENNEHDLKTENNEYESKSEYTIERIDLKDTEGITTFRQLLLIRFLQKYDMFPKRNAYQSEKEEFKFIGALCGLTYDSLKTAKPKVAKLIECKVTSGQVYSKINDLHWIRSVAQSLELTDIVKEADLYIERISKLKSTY